MEHDQWMNDLVRGEIEDLQRRYGFEENEAVAFWHIQEAGRLMADMRAVDLRKELDREEGKDDQAFRQQALLATHVAQWYAVIFQHFAALNNALGTRVLRRHYPDGWGRRYQANDAPGMDQ